MYGRKSAHSVKHPYSRIKRQGVQFRQELIRSIDPHSRKVTTDQGIHMADLLVIALGADYDIGATPGLSEGGHEFYSFEGAERVRDILPTFTGGNFIIGVTSFPFKCPPAPSEAALLLHEYLVRRGIRQKCKISLVLPFDLFLAIPEH